MDNFPEHIVREDELMPASRARPSVEDWALFAEGALMTPQELHSPQLREYAGHPELEYVYWRNFCKLIGSVTGGDLSHEDFVMIDFGVELHAVHNLRDVPRMMVPPPHGNCEEDCYQCTLYRNSLLIEFGFELSKFVGYDGVDTSVFEIYANDGYDDVAYFNDDDGNEVVYLNGYIYVNGNGNVFDVNGFDDDGFDING